MRNFDVYILSMQGSDTVSSKKNFLSQVNHDPRVKRVCKRSFDLAVSIVGLTKLAFIIIKYGGDLKKETGSSLFYHDVRIGKGGKPFTFWKLRTMKPIYDDHNNIRSIQDRIGTLGKMMRERKLDEYAQFINVFSGNMHVVGGYRPHKRVDYDFVDEPEFHQRKPAITNKAKWKHGTSISHFLERLLGVQECWDEDKRGAWQTFLHDFNTCLNTLRSEVDRDEKHFYDHSKHRMYTRITP